ncbi:MAG TPA: methyltransferase domain-containing protein [Gammaproteobacteria bacterium]|nr:methyltransferase domain-containing protein [Gammaproteobacteria bacterium]
MNIQSAVARRYSKGAQTVEPSLCCPVDYDNRLLAALPREIIEKDYGCGDPSRYARPGDTVLDLGSGAGKICYMAAQVVGDQGRVIGVDMNDDMLALARKYRTQMARALGGDRVTFVKGHIEDLALDMDKVDRYLKEHPIRCAEALDHFDDWKTGLRRNEPLIADACVDLVISNCVLNLVNDADKAQLIQEIHRVLKPGGRVAISDIVSDEPVPRALKEDPELWSGCVSGAFEERAFMQAFVDAGFLAVAYDKWEAVPWRIIEGIEFRAVTLVAVKGEGTPRMDLGHAVVYRGPCSSVTDDEGHVFPRGERMAVCERTFKLLTEGPYKDHFIGIAPATPPEPTPWCTPAGTRRAPTQTKGARHAQIGDAGTGTGCC